VELWWQIGGQLLSKIGPSHEFQKFNRLKFSELRRKWANREPLTRYMIFENRAHLMEFMVRSLSWNRNSNPNSNPNLAFKGIQANPQIYNFGSCARLLCGGDGGYVTIYIEQGSFSSDSASVFAGYA
jgi:hypothetical protein